MAQFPGIEYSTASPSGRYGGVHGNLDVSTGGEAIAQGLMAIGGAFQKIQDAKDAADLSTLKRRFDEVSYEAYNKYTTTGDETLRQTIREQWDKSITGLTKEKKVSGRVINAFNAHKDNALPQWGQNFANQELAIQKRQMVDTFKYNITKNMESGNIIGAATDIETMVSMNQMSRAEADGMIENLPVDSVLSQALLLIDDPNPQTLQDSLNKAVGMLTELKGLSVEQSMERYKLLDWAAGQQKRLEKANQDTAEKQLNLFSKGLLDHTITQQDIEDSKLSTKKDGDNASTKELFNAYVAGSHKDPPKLTSQDGYTNVVSMVLKFSEKGLTKEEAYIELNNARFIDRTINDNIYIWAVNKIEKPYSRDVVMPLKTILEYNRASKHGLIETKEDLRESQNIGMSVLDWVDKKIEAGQIPTGGDIAAINAEYWQTLINKKKVKTNYTPYNLEQEQIDFYLNSMGLKPNKPAKETTPDVLKTSRKFTGVLSG